MACAALAPAPTRAEPPGENRFERYSRELVVQSDGSFVETIDDEIVIGAHAASGGAVQRALHWNASTGTIEIVEAATVKPDGSRVQAPAEMMLDSTDLMGDGVFRDQRHRVITYLEADPGDRVVLRAVHRRTIPFFDRHFFDDRGPPEYAAREARIVYDVPETIELHFDALGYEADPVEHANGRRRHTWRYAGSRPARNEHRAVAVSDYADRLSASTMRDYRSLAHAYLARACDRADPTPEIRALALELTRAAATTLDRARALYDWVRRHVRYGGIHLGQAAVVPRSAPDTLSRREGDCKDQSTLFEALLSSVGISSSPVMINAGGAYRLPAVPTLGVFNHVLVWIPSLGLFADPSASFTPFGELPTAVSGKPALIVKTALLSRTPAQRPLAHSVRLDGEIDADGLSRFTLEDTPRGWFAGSRRAFFAFADDDELRRASEAMLYVSRLIGSASVQARGGSTESDPVRLVMRGEVSGVALPGQPGRIRALSSVGVGIEQALDDFHPMREHLAPSICVSRHVHERANWMLAPGLGAAEAPGGLSIRGDGFFYESTYRVVGRRLEIRRTLRVDFGDNVCTPSRFRVVQRLARDVLVDLATSFRTAPVRSR